MKNESLIVAALRSNANQIARLCEVMGDKEGPFPEGEDPRIKILTDMVDQLPDELWQALKDHMNETSS